MGGTCRISPRKRVRTDSSCSCVTATGRVFTAGGGAATRLPVPAAEVAVTVDPSMPQHEVDRRFDETIGSALEPSRWQTDALPLEQRPFPVEALDEPTS